MINSIARVSRWLGVLVLCAASHCILADDEQDPWQGYNRAMFDFNITVDRYTLKPITKGYVFITPKFVQKGINNALSNVGEVPNILNGILQGQPVKASKYTGRLLVNSTLGLAGLFDVAQHMGLVDDGGEDFGQTLAVWGVSQGPYVVLPLLGSSTVRDTFALPADWYSDPLTYIDHVPTRNSLRAISVVNTRANLLGLEEHLTGDHYIFIRDAYLQRRNFLINNGDVEDEFGLDDDFGDEDDYGY